MTMFGYIVVTIALGLSSTLAQEEEMMVPDNKTQCIKQMVQWCDGMKYSEQPAGMAMLSISFEDRTGYFRVFCSSDSDGTNCTKNGRPWFACSSENTLTYNGKILTAEGSDQDVDNDICNTADRAFNDLFVQNLSYDNTTLKTELEKGMESFFEHIAAMQEQIELIQKRLSRMPLFNGDIWNGFDDEFLFDINNDNNVNITTEQTNQIERE